jgi:hypothetical protein
MYDYGNVVSCASDPGVVVSADREDAAAVPSLPGIEALMAGRPKMPTADVSGYILSSALVKPNCS